jgi:hypothetical protein
MLLLPQQLLLLLLHLGQPFLPPPAGRATRAISALTVRADLA